MSVGKSGAPPLFPATFLGKQKSQRKCGGERHPVCPGTLGMTKHERIDRRTPSYRGGRSHFLEKSQEAPQFCPGRKLIPGMRGTDFLIYSSRSPRCFFSNYCFPFHPRPWLVTNNLLQISLNAPKRELAFLPPNSLQSLTHLGSHMILITPSLDLNFPSLQSSPPCTLAEGGPREQSWHRLLTSFFPKDLSSRC